MSSWLDLFSAPSLALCTSTAAPEAAEASAAVLRGYAAPKAARGRRAALRSQSADSGTWKAPEKAKQGLRVLELLVDDSRSTDFSRQGPGSSAPQEQLRASPIELDETLH